MLTTENGMFDIPVGLADVESFPVVLSHEPFRVAIFPGLIDEARVPGRKLA